LKKTETETKSVLPSTSEINAEKTMQNIESFNKDQLKTAETIVKDRLPSKEDIESEKAQ